MRPTLDPEGTLAGATREMDGGPWRAVYAVAVVLVLGAFLYSLREILHPVLLFGLLVLLLWPFSPTRSHSLVLGSAGALTGIWLLKTTGSLLAPFFLALAIAYILRPLVRRLERGPITRTWAIVLLFLPLVGLLAAVVLLGIPALSRQVAGFIERLPFFLQEAVGWAERARGELLRQDLPFVDEDALLDRLRGLTPETVVAYLQARQAAIASQVWEAVLGAGRGLGALLTVLGYLFLTPILGFYLLRDYERITAWLAGLVPLRRRPAVTAFALEYDRLLSRYLRGQLIAAATVGVLTGIGFWILGFPYALLLGVVAGVFNVVPYLGLIVSLVPALIIALFSGSFLLSLGKIALVFAVVQLLDGSVIGPKIVGESVGLHPVWVILALSVSGFFFGFVGLLLAIPLAVLVKLLLRLALDRYHASSLYLGEG